MRLSRLFAIGLFALVAAGMAMSQQPPGQQKGPGGKGKGPDTGYIGLFQNPQVRAEQSGKGLMGLHAATDSYPKTWPLYAGIIGGGFNGHPWTKLVPVKNADPSNVINASLEGKDFEVDDEIYQFRLDTAKPTQLRYLLVLDVVKMGPDALRGNRKGDGPYPVSWIGNIGQGRVYYNSLGHREQIFWNPTVLKHYLAGIQFALGDLEADATPTAKATSK